MAVGLRHSRFNRCSQAQESIANVDRNTIGGLRLFVGRRFCIYNWLVLAVSRRLSGQCYCVKFHLFPDAKSDPMGN